MKTLSKESEQLILETIESVCADVSGGTNPTDAVVKAAEENDLTPNFIRLVCTGYNTGAHNYQREKNATVLEKYAEFPLADADQAIERLYPKVTKAACVSDEYSRAPKALPTSKAAHESLATIKLPMVEKKASVLASIQKLESAQKETAKTVAEFRKLAQVFEAKRTAYSNIQEKLLEKLSEFCEVCGSGSRGYSQGEIECALVREHGQSGKQLLNLAIKANDWQEKAAALTRPVDWNTPVFKLASECLELSRQLIDSRTECHNAKEAADKANPFFSYQKSAEGLGLGAMGIGVLGTDAAKFMGSTIQPKPKEDLISGMQSKLQDNDEEIRTIRAQTMLADLLANDEVISGYQPQEVYDAYNEISSVSPRAATQPALMRPLIRKRLTSGGLEPFEAAEMTNIEKSLSESENPRLQPKTSEERKVNVITHRILG